LTIAGCHIDVRKGWITFDMEGRFAVFYHTKEDSSLLDALPRSPEIDIEDVLSCQDPPDSD